MKHRVSKEEIMIDIITSLCKMFTENKMKDMKGFIMNKITVIIVKDKEIVIQEDKILVNINKKIFQHKMQMYKISNILQITQKNTRFKEKNNNMKTVLWKRTILLNKPPEE